MDIQEYFPQLEKVLAAIDKESVRALAALILETKTRDAFVYVLGNGGSGANASHFVQDLLKCPVKNFQSTEGRFKALCLNDNTPVIMAYGNDRSYEEIFVQQLMNFCRPRDLVVALSGSGKSKNVIQAVEFAKSAGAKTFSIVGFDGGNLLKVSDAYLHIQTNNMQLYEDACMATLHGVISSLL